MGRKKNSFSKAINHLKSKNIDEKLEMLNEIPTNNTSSIYSVVPNSVTVGTDTTQTVPDYSTVDFEVNGNDGRDTSGLFDESGNSKFIAPPGDNSYILGPMVAMYYTWAIPWTQIGYIRESDRRMVNLGTIYSTLGAGGSFNGKLSDWDGSGFDQSIGNQIFFSYGQLTLEQAQWFLNTPKKDNAGNDPANANYRAFYPGPPSNVADEFGRYLCTITGTPKGTKEEIKTTKKAPMDQQGSDNFAAIMDRLRKGKKLTKDEEEFLKNFGTFDADGNYIPPGFEDAIGTDEIGDTQIGDTQGEFMPSNPNFRGAGNNKNFDPNEPNGPVSDNLLDTLKQAAQNFGDIVSDKIEKVIDNALEYLSKPLPDRPKTGQGGRPLGDTTIRGGGVDSAGRYNLALATNLPISIISGQPFEIPVSKSGAISMVNSITSDYQLSSFNNALTINQSTPTDAENTINPVEKTDQVLGNGWQVQGGSTFNFNTKTNELEIVSNKTLRSTSGGESVTKDVTGKITRFTDIPDLDIEKAQAITDKALQNPVVDKFLDGLANTVKVVEKIGGGESYEYMGKTYNNAWDLMKNNQDTFMYSDFRDTIADLAKTGAEGTVQGTASNAYAIRDFLQNLEVKSSIDSKGWKPFAQNSDIEKIGGAKGHVYSNVKVPYDKLPPKLQAIINSKSNVKESISQFKRSSIMKTLKDPVVIRETKQKSYKVRPGKRSNYHQGMDKLIGDVKPQKSFKKPANMWSQGWQEYNARSSQDRKNIVLEKIGESKHAWKYMLEHGTMMDAKNLEEFWGKNPDLYSYFFNGKKYKTVRKEQVKGDYIVFLVDEFGAKSSMLQSELNIKLIEEEEEKMLAEYNKLNNIESIPYEKDPLFKKVSKRLKKEIDYPEKPARKGYPNEPPPKLGPDGFHPDFGKKYKYDKLDPISATTMSNAPTGNSEIDANVKKASLKSKVKEGYSDWRSEIEKK